MSLRYREDHYDGVIIDSSDLPEDAEDFQGALQISLEVNITVCKCKTTQ